MDWYFDSDVTCRYCGPTATALQAAMNKLKRKLLGKSHGWNLRRPCHPLQGYTINTYNEQGCFDLKKNNNNEVIYKLVKHGNGELHLPPYNVSNINFHVSPMQ